jgi:DNA-directed RNA polymerase beta' subunit
MVLKLNPIVFKGFGADADGDEMSIHALLDKSSNAEAEKLSPTHRSNILSAASGEPILDFDQDFVLGNFLLNGEKKSIGITRIEQLIKDEEKFQSIILSEMRASFDKVTRDGVSFSFIELLNCRISEGAIENLMSVNSDNINTELEDAVKIKLEEIVSNESNPGYYFAAMAHSSARGKKQTRQVLAARGMLSPGLKGFVADDTQYIIPESLVDGMTPDSSYLSTFNARSSMIDKNIGTFKAGYLMRKLVLAMWPYHIVVGNCGAETMLECEYLPNYKICTHCYDIEVTDNYPAGLIAAQSIGERCTQLTMSSFHSGEKGVTLDDVEKILSNLPDEFHQFYNELHSVPALKDIGKEHFKMLWLVIKSSSDETLSKAINNGHSALSVSVGIDGFRSITKSMKYKNSNYHPLAKLITSNWDWN